MTTNVTDRAEPGDPLDLDQIETTGKVIDLMAALKDSLQETFLRDAPAQVADLREHFDVRGEAGFTRRNIEFLLKLGEMAVHDTDGLAALRDARQRVQELEAENTSLWGGK